MTSLFQE